MITGLLISFIFSLLFIVREKTGIFTVFYLTLLPFIIFSGLAPSQIFIPLLLGYLLFRLFHRPSLFIFVVFILTLGIFFLVIKPRLGLDMGLLNSINSQRGEHARYLTDPIARIIHNKTELVHSFIANFDKLLSPVAIFASGFWHHIGRYYPLGFLFPWDIYFIYLFFKNRKSEPKTRPVFFLLALFSLFLITGLIYIDQALIFGFAVIYYLALVSALGYASSSRKVRICFFVLNSVYLLYQLTVTAYFKI